MAVAKNRFTFLAVVIFLLSTSLFAQFDIVENPAANIFDTTEYMPYIYSDALNYNLMIASSKGYVTEIERLIRLGADVKAETPDGASALVFAVSNRKPGAVAVLLSHDAVVDKITASWETPLMIAVKNQSFEIAEMLIRNGAEINHSDRLGATSLHYAATYGYTDITDLLLYYEADPGLKTTDGSTPLHGAIWAGQITVADILLQNGADAGLKDNNGMTPFLLSAWFGDTVAMELLSRYGADIGATNNKGYNALTLAIMSEQADAVNYLLGKRTTWEVSGLSADPYAVAAKYHRKDMISLLQEKKVPGRPRYQVDQVSFTLSSRITARDMYSGLAIDFREPLTGMGFTAGFDTKLWPTRVLVKASDALYYQYRDRSSLAFAGIFKDFPLKETASGADILFTASLRGGYSFGNSFKGSYAAPESRFRILPAATFRINMSKISLSASIEYANTGFYRPLPVWLRLGISWTSFFDDLRMIIKPPKWY